MARIGSYWVLFYAAGGCLSNLGPAFQEFEMRLSFGNAGGRQSHTHLHDCSSCGWIHFRYSDVQMACIRGQELRPAWRATRLPSSTIPRVPTLHRQHRRAGHLAAFVQGVVTPRMLGGRRDRVPQVGSQITRSASEPAASVPLRGYSPNSFAGVSHITWTRRGRLMLAAVDPGVVHDGQHSLDGGEP